MVKRCMAVLMVWGVLAFAATAAAQAPTAEAEVLFQRGVALGEVERWLEAHELFRQSFAIVERPTTLFNMAYALFRAGRFHGAVARLDQLLSRPDVGDRRHDAERLRAEAITLTAELALELAPPESTVEVDGAQQFESGSHRTLPVDPGLHRVVVRAPGHAERQFDLTLAPGERAVRSVDLLPLVAPMFVESEAPRSVVDEPVFWVLLVGGVLVVAGGVTVGAVVASQATPPYGGSAGVVIEALRF